MRLAQLARKLSLKPSDVVDFLNTRGIKVEDSSNARIEDAHVNMILVHFGGEVISEVGVASSIEETPAPPQNEGESDPMEEDTPSQVSDSPDESEKAEVIKAPKVSLPGLKVVGKIDLPELKKKEAKPDDEDTLPEAQEGQDENQQPQKQERTRKQGRDFHNRNPRRKELNPIALQRQKEEREELRKRQEEQQRQKELRTRRYLKQVNKHAPPPRPLKKKNREEEYEVYTEQAPPPKTVFGKILRWLTAR